MMLKRRDFVRTLAAGAAAVNLPRLCAEGGPASQKVTDKISLISGAGNNIVVLAGDGGNLLVDCGSAEHASEVLKLAGPVSTVFNTHWHIESTGGNDVFAKSGAKIVSQISTQLWMTQDVVHDWEKKTYPARPKEAQPKETFYTTGKTTFGGEHIEYGLMPLAHTDGDIFVHFLDSNVMAVGDAMQPGRLPILDWFCGGWIGGMQEAHRTILKRANDSTKIIAASGAVMSKAQVQASLDVLTKMRESLVGLIKKGKGAQDLIDGKAVAEFQGQLAGDPDVFLYIAYRGLWAHARELGGIV